MFGSRLEGCQAGSQSTGHWSSTNSFTLTSVRALKGPRRSYPIWTDYNLIYGIFQI